MEYVSKLGHITGSEISEHALGDPANKSDLALALTKSKAVDLVVKTYIRSLNAHGQTIEYDDLRQELILILMQKLETFDPSMGTLDNWVKAYGHKAVRGAAQRAQYLTRNSDSIHEVGYLLTSADTSQEAERLAVDFLLDRKRGAESAQKTAWRKSVALRQIIGVPPPARLFGLERAKAWSQVLAPAGAGGLAPSLELNLYDQIFAHWSDMEREALLEQGERALKIVSVEGIGALPWPGKRVKKRVIRRVCDLLPYDKRWAVSAGELVNNFFASEVADAHTLTDQTTTEKAERLDRVSQEVVKTFPTVVANLIQVSTLLHESFWAEASLSFTYDQELYSPA